MNRPSPTDNTQVPTPKPTIVVPVDNSEQSRQALITAATRYDADLVILYVLKPYRVVSVTEPAVWDDEFTSRRKHKAEQLLEEYRDLVATYGVDACTELSQKSPTRAIRDVSEKFNADHIVMSHAWNASFLWRLLYVLFEIVTRRASVSLTIANSDDPEVQLN